MSATDQDAVSSANAETIAAWDGPLFERFSQYRHIVVAAGSVSTSRDAQSRQSGKQRGKASVPDPAL